MMKASNSQIKQIRKLRERKERRQTNLFYVEGLRIVGEAIQTGARIEFIVTSPELLISSFGHQLLQSAKAQSIPILEVDAVTFASFSQKDGPQGLGAVVYQDWNRLDRVAAVNAGIPLSKDLWIALDAVQDPGNLGTILRTSDAVGGSGIILLDYSTDPYDPTAVRASMGAIFSQKLIKADLSSFADWKKTSQVPVVGTSGKAELDYHVALYPETCILLMGSERQGLTENHLRLCDMIVKIPMIGRSDSLNLAVATAVILYEIYNQRRS
jgi:TrmH family RNA methyltransferase